MSPPASVFDGDILAALDPVRLAERAGLTLDPWQVAALRSRAPRALWCAARQTGKSTLAGLAAVHQAVYVPDSLVLLVAPALRQSQEGMQKVAQLYAATGRPVPADVENRLTLELANGSRIVCLPGAERTTRGFSRPALVVLDEASRIDDALFHAITPMLSTRPDGRLLAISTPNGQLGWWHAAWVEGGDLWERVKVTAYECPRISPQFLETERASMPASVFAQEYECTFAQVEDGAFRAEDVYAMLSDDVAPRFPQPAPSPPPPPVDLSAYLS